MKISIATKDAYRTTKNPLRFLRIRRALLSFDGKTPFDGDFSGYLTSYSKDGQLDPSGYSLVLCGAWENLGIYRDTVYSFVLKRGYSTLACIGFDIEEDRTLEVKQIQGVKGAQEDLSHLKWERMLLIVVTDWASRYGFRQVRVQRAEDNEWVKRAETLKWEEVRQELTERLRMRHDVTARRSGFRLDNRGYYVRDL